MAQITADVAVVALIAALNARQVYSCQYLKQGDSFIVIM